MRREGINHKVRKGHKIKFGIANCEFFQLRVLLAFVVSPSFKRLKRLEHLEAAPRGYLRVKLL